MKGPVAGKLGRVLSGAAAAAALLLFPSVTTGTYAIHVLILTMIFVILAVGLDVVLGYCGQYSFAQGAFFGIGAYTAGLLATRLGWSFWATLPAGIVMAALFGLIVGAPSLRLAGHFLAITTIAFQVIVYLVLSQWYALTGGTHGIAKIPGVPPIVLGGEVVARFDTPAGYYYLCLAVSAITIWLAWRLAGSRLGREWLAINGDEVLAQALGINTTLRKVLAFTISAALAGAAGVLLAHYMTNIHPSEFTIWSSAIIVAMVIVGGRASIIGPVVGAVVLMLLPEVLRSAEDYKLIIYGLSMILFVTVLPDGLVGLWHALRRRDG